MAMESGVFRSVRAEPWRRSPACTPPPCAPESPLSAESLGRDIPGAQSLGFREPRCSASREQASGIRASLSVFIVSPFPLRDYPEIYEGPFHGDPVLEIQGLLPRLGLSE